jgi:hypothetical protein
VNNFWLVDCTDLFSRGFCITITDRHCDILKTLAEDRLPPLESRFLDGPELANQTHS